MDDEQFLKALQLELQEYSSLRIDLYTYSVRHALLVRRIACEDKMLISLSDGKLICKLWQRKSQNNTSHKIDEIDLANPKAIEQLLQLLKKELR